MSYVVLARKWRPEHFEEVVGQGHVARTLKNSIEQNRVAHAYLFTGARGVGKTSTARILAKALNCKEGPTATPCYKCASCTEISAGQSVDVFEIDGASNRGINEIRELREGARYAPSRDAKKVYIIDEVHMLTTEAFNALLKILEEPPPHVIFIFATTEPQKIPVTILSRCQRFDFKRIVQRDIVEHLEHLCRHEEIQAERAALQLIARQAAGGMRDALSLLDQIISFAGKNIREDQIAEILGVANRKHLFELSEAILARNTERALIVLDDVNRFGYDLNQFASELVNHFRDLMVTAVVKKPEDVTDLTESELQQARAQLQGIPKDLLHRHFTIMVDGARDMHRSPYPKLIFEMTLVRMAELEPLIGLDLLIDKLQALESTLEDSGTTAPPMQIPPSRTFSAPTPTNPTPTPAPTPAIQQQPENRAPASTPTKPEENLTPPDEPDPAPPSPEPTPQPEPKTQEPKTQEPDLSTPENRWKFLVQQLSLNEEFHTAGLCEHAYLEQFDNNLVHLSFDEIHMSYVDDKTRLSMIEQTIQQHFGQTYRLHIETRHAEQPTTITTLAQQHKAENDRLRTQLHEDIRQHPTILSAQQLFQTENIRVQAQLHDD